MLGKEPAVSPWKTNHFLTFDELLFIGDKQADKSTLLSHLPLTPFPRRKNKKHISHRPSKPDSKKQVFRLWQLK